MSRRVAWIVAASVVGVTVFLWGLPHYNVWQQGLAGEAELRRAEQNRKIAVQEAEAKRDAAKQLAQAEIERARGVAEANKIIGESLRENESYLRYLWLQALDNAGSTIIYVPTEANLPLLEATRLQHQQPKEPK